MEDVYHEDFFSIDLNEGEGVSSPADRNSLSIQAINKLGKEVTVKISAGMGLVFINPNEATGEVCFANERGLRPEFMQSFTPVDLLNYIYAVLHSPGYGEKYEESLKIGLAPIPYPTSADEFWRLVKSGSDIQRLQ